MNARSQIFEFTSELCQVEEVSCSILHTLLFHRSTGKFRYQQQGSYTIGTVGFEDVDCQYIDCTYVRCSSDELHRDVLSCARQFRDVLKKMDGHKTGEISIEFYQKRKNPWPFPQENVPWEQWLLKFDIISLASETERIAARERLTENVLEKIRTICEVVNQPEYVPKMPNEPDLTNVFDDQYIDVQPYLYKISYQTSEYNPDISVGNTMRRLIKDTFNY